MLFVFSLLSFINILLFAIKVLQGVSGWSTLGVAIMLGWAGSMGANLEERNPKSAFVITLIVSLIAAGFGLATTLKGRVAIGDPELLALIILVGTLSTAMRNYLDVAEEA